MTTKSMTPDTMDLKTFVQYFKPLARTFDSQMTSNQWVEYYKNRADFIIHFQNQSAVGKTQILNKMAADAKTTREMSQMARLHFCRQQPGKQKELLKAVYAAATANRKRTG